MPSPEQSEVAKLCITQNVVVSARPGSGKTAAAEAIVAAYPDMRVIVLTYSRRLQVETHKRLRDYANCEVRTFHSLAGLLFNRTMHKDAELVEERQRVLDSKKLPQWDSEPFDIIILDEIQDCTDLLFWLIGCFIRANGRGNIGQPARIVVLGDERQSIYKFRGADHRYLTLAPEVLSSLSPYSFANIPLSNSFRLSEECIRFINNAFLDGEPYISSVKSGPKPIVLRCDPFDSYRLVEKLFPYIKLHGARNSAIIAPSTRNNKPLRKIVNTLSENYGIPISVPIDDGAPLNDKVVHGKLCVSTIHQFKGSERDLTIIFGIDDSFFQHFGRNYPDDRCPNEVFVALTRARNQLILIHNDKEKLMPFVSIDALCNTADVVNMTDEQTDIAPPNEPGRPLNLAVHIPPDVFVRESTRYAQNWALRNIVQQHLYIRQLSPPLPESERIDMRSIVLSDPKRKSYESVSDINGLVVAAAFEHRTSGTLKTLGIQDKAIADSIPPVGSDHYIPWLCRQACKYEASASGYLPRSNQMKNHPFDWVASGDLSRAQSRLAEEVKIQASQHLEFEVGCSRTMTVANREVTVYGRADIIAASISPDSGKDKCIDLIWEIKFVSRLSDEDFLQAAMYTYLFATANDGKLPRTILYNVRDGNKWEISSRDGEAGLQRMIQSVLTLRYSTAEELSHADFIDSCTKTTKEVLSLGL